MADNSDAASKLIRSAEAKQNEGTGVMLPYEPLHAILEGLLDRIDELENELNQYPWFFGEDL